mmetsp:Transcript_10891/g.19819  ORF Transcript_10891/g.19819 Transcript_10891/m.19819 type:complete len:269 (-) Transcript_10891:303-1109(-)|eukprot:CAMPEP_0201897300 /NCGR_PEP_ID=MMETSP0902-20130614/46305_1 /ASSEMBLY_ACC=CAM_ASM_000551 /TAXON_ID=420261 /ORGANISM="Thalassiosira antarctica, Strain CCMP982" /LENGTH=268 /DNA_ID=CAMNT_0048430131 /DNA_START=52 /DNA_END=858 /DNA_ORIENTATION=+
MSKPDAEAKKDLGNKAYAAKEYDEAIKHYTGAIALDSKNCVYYSNRSACYGSKKDWANAAKDAKECIKFNPSFIKGYYRLASAQSELNEFDAALATIKQGLAIESDNPQLQKQMRTVKAKRSGMRRTENAAKAAPSSGAAMPGGMYRNLDSSISKEVNDLQQQLIATTKEYRMVRANITRAQNGKKSNELTRQELDKLPQGTDAKMYRGVGKMFMLTSRSDIMTHLEESVDKEGKEEKNLTAKSDYLEKRMKSQQQNILELTKSASSE